MYNSTDNYHLHKSTSRTRIGQDPSLHARKFCRPNSGVGVLEQSRCSASTARVLMYIRSV